MGVHVPEDDGVVVGEDVVEGGVEALGAAALRWDVHVDECGVVYLDGEGLEYWVYLDVWELFKED